METPESIRTHEQEFLPNAWMMYTVEELDWWIKPLTKRAGMRVEGPKKDKDLWDVENYRKMRDAMVADLDSGLR